MTTPHAYERITEQWDSPMTAGQIAMANTRYNLAADHAAGRDLIEIGCGAGFGLAALAAVARRVVGGDISAANTAVAFARTGLPIVRFDAHHVPFRDASFDVALMYENLYYLRRPGDALDEARRVLRPGGVLLVCLPNRQRPGFHPSPYSVAYHSATELEALLRRHGYEPALYGGFPVGGGGAAERIFLRAAAAAATMHLVPRTLKGRARIKRMLFGRLPMFRGLDRDAAVGALESIRTAGPVTGYKNLYAVARRDG